MSKKSIEDIKIPTYDDLFKNEEQRQDDKLEKLQEIPLNEIHEFNNHPFRVRMDNSMIDLIESIRENGILMPALVRPSPNGQGYEMVSGHRRMKASEMLNKKTISAVVRNYTDDEATIIMVDSNIQRENILPSERGWAYKLKLEALKNQGKRTDLTLSQLGTKLKRSDEILAEQVGESRNQIQRYIRLTELIDDLRDLVDGVREDGKKISFNPAVELSYLKVKEQVAVVKYIEDLNRTPSHAQTIRLKNLSKEERLNDDVIYAILSEEKANEKEKLSFKMEDINEFFPKHYTYKQKSNLIMQLLSNWSKEHKKTKEKGRER